MSGFKGTKGKWEVLNTNPVESHLDIAINSDNSDCVAWVYSQSDYRDINGKANALLISKAPEMLEMLELMVKEFDVEFTNKYQFDLHQKAKKLIKEATEL